MKRDDFFKSDRHEALSDRWPSCSSDACWQGRRACPVPQACQVSESPLTWGDAVMALCIVLALVGFVLLGPMAQGLLRGWV